MTELMSNVALVAVLAPVVAGIALGLEIPILYLLIPVTMASSCAFMLPMATPPNAIVFASGIKVAQMARGHLYQSHCCCLFGHPISICDSFNLLTK